MQNPEYAAMDTETLAQEYVKAQAAVRRYGYDTEAGKIAEKIAREMLLVLRQRQQR